MSKSPALHGSPSEKKSKQMNKETPTKSRKRNQNEADEKDEKETPVKKRKGEENESNDETTDSVDDKNDKVMEVDVKQQQQQQQQQDVGVPATVPVDVDNVKKEPDPSAGVVVTVLVANHPDNNPCGSKQQEEPEVEEEVEGGGGGEEKTSDSERVLTVDPKTGLLGTETTHVEQQQQQEKSPSTTASTTVTTTTTATTSSTWLPGTTSSLSVCKKEDVSPSSGTVGLVIPNVPDPASLRLLNKTEQTQPTASTTTTTTNTIQICKPVTSMAGCTTGNSSNINNVTGISKIAPATVVKIEPKEDVRDGCESDKETGMNFTMSRLQSEEAVTSVVKSNSSCGSLLENQEDQQQQQQQQQQLDKDQKPTNLNLPARDGHPAGFLHLSGLPPHVLGPIPTHHHFNYPAFGTGGGGVAGGRLFTDKPPITIPTYPGSTSTATNEQPQNLKIKQEVGTEEGVGRTNSTLLQGPSIENIKKEQPENYSSTVTTGKSGLNQDGTLQSNPNLRIEREKDNRDYGGLGGGGVVVKEVRDLKPEHESHTPPLPRTNVTPSPLPANVGYV